MGEENRKNKRQLEIEIPLLLFQRILNRLFCFGAVCCSISTTAAWSSHTGWQQRCSPSEGLNSNSQECRFWTRFWKTLTLLLGWIWIGFWLNLYWFDLRYNEFYWVFFYLFDLNRLNILKWTPINMFGFVMAVNRFRRPNSELHNCAEIVEMSWSATV